LPANPTLSVLQSKNILDFLGAQDNSKELIPPMIFELVQKVISDAKQSSRDQGEGGSSFSKLFEKHRVEAAINKLMNKLPNE
jgi:hypothetical protein